jgi:hypothetical protein
MLSAGPGQHVPGEDVADVGLDGLLADYHLAGDLAALVPLANQPQPKRP